MPELNGIPLWYAIRTRSRHEKQVRDRFVALGVEQLLPTIKRLNQWKDRKKEIEWPLFPGYCFARFSWQDRLAVLKVGGVVDIIGNASGPEPIPEQEMQAIKVLITSTLEYDSYPYLREGMPVEVIRGPLEGVQGVLVRKDKRHRLVIAVHLIQQAAAVEIDARDVVPVYANTQM
ncbi:MAG TPA: UpxY family transcription antiterminator [Nitrospirales bacterium]